MNSQHIYEMFQVMKKKHLLIYDIIKLLSADVLTCSSTSSDFPWNDFEKTSKLLSNIPPQAITALKFSGVFSHSKAFYLHAITSNCSTVRNNKHRNSKQKKTANSIQSSNSTNNLMRSDNQIDDIVNHVKCKVDVELFKLKYFLSYFVIDWSNLNKSNYIHHERKLNCGLVAGAFREWKTSKFWRTQAVIIKTLLPNDVYSFLHSCFWHILTLVEINF